MKSKIWIELPHKLYLEVETPESEKRIEQGLIDFGAKIDDKELANQGSGLYDWHPTSFGYYWGANLEKEGFTLSAQYGRWANLLGAMALEEAVRQISEDSRIHQNLHIYVEFGKETMVEKERGGFNIITFGIGPVYVGMSLDSPKVDPIRERLFRVYKDGYKIVGYDQYRDSEYSIFPAPIPDLCDIILDELKKIG